MGEVFSVTEDSGLTLFGEERKMKSIQQLLEGSIIVGSEAPFLHLQGNRPIHRSSIDIEVTQSPGQLFPNGAFSSPRGAINGDDQLSMIQSDVLCLWGR